MRHIFCEGEKVVDNGGTDDIMILVDSKQET
jgi:hypothetical protein